MSKNPTQQEKTDLIREALRLGLLLHVNEEFYKRSGPSIYRRQTIRDNKGAPLGHEWLLSRKSVEDLVEEISLPELNSTRILVGMKRNNK